MAEQFFAMGPGLRRVFLKVNINTINVFQWPFWAFGARPLKNALAIKKMIDKELIAFKWIEALKTELKKYPSDYNELFQLYSDGKYKEAFLSAGLLIEARKLHVSKEFEEIDKDFCFSLR